MIGIIKGVIRLLLWPFHKSLKSSEEFGIAHSILSERAEAFDRKMRETFRTGPETYRESYIRRFGKEPPE